ncbi:hypothetical protein KC845_00425 [Candidatus Kaiserbacteria bacterium]|nr:hypothetical protein [Candidatus Kaiserbacteria bacterium]
MTNLQKCLTVLFIILLAGAILYKQHSRNPNPDNQKDDTLHQATNEVEVTEFRELIEKEVRSQLGQPIEGYEPAMFKQVFPALRDIDFDGVEAEIGHYEYKDGQLVHELGEVEVVHSAAPAISERGYQTLLQNIKIGFEFENNDLNISDLVTILKEKYPFDDYESDYEVSDEDGYEDMVGPVACTMEAKLCPDGSAVGRVGPNCEFAECPAGSDVSVGEHTCTEEMKSAEACTMDYAPVCGLVEVQCVTTPCPPVPQTFGNACTACSQGRVISYEDGECEAPQPI